MTTTMITKRAKRHYQNRDWAVFFDPSSDECRWYTGNKGYSWPQVTRYDNVTPAEKIGRAFKRSVSDALLSLIL